MMSDQLDHKIIRKDERQKDSDRRQRCRHNRTPYLFRSLRYRTFGRTTGCRQAIDILQHDDTVVQQHPDRKRHTDQRQAVDRYTERIKEIECRIDRNRYGKSDKEYQPQVLQEQPQDQYGQQPAHQGQINDLVDIVLHRFRRILLHHNLHVQISQLLVQPVDRLEGAVRQVDQVRLRIVHQGNRDGILPVHTAIGSLLFQVEEDRSNIFQQYRTGSDHDILQIGYFRIKGVDMDKVLAVRLIRKTDKGFILRILCQQATDRRRCKVQGFAGFPVQPDLDRFLPSAIDIYGCHPVDILQISADLFIHDIPHPVDTSRTAYLQNHKVVRQLADIHLLQLHRKAFGEGSSQLVHLLLQFEGSDLEVHRILKIDLYGRLAAVDG